MTLTNGRNIFQVPREQVDTKWIVFIESRTLIREAITLALRGAAKTQVTSFPAVDNWLEVAKDYPASVILLSVARDAAATEAIRQFALASGSSVPVILIVDSEEPNLIVDALERGMRGFVPTSMSLEIALQAIGLVAAGGVFVPASSLIAARRVFDRSTATDDTRGELTSRQLAVVEAIRHGKSNKVIAYELNMCESTVKVHVRNIMRKLKARNRTQVAVMKELRNGTDRLP